VIDRLIPILPGAFSLAAAVIGLFNHWLGRQHRKQLGMTQNTVLKVEKQTNGITETLVRREYERGIAEGQTMRRRALRKK
jgi:hypothetical protein